MMESHRKNKQISLLVMKKNLEKLFSLKIYDSTSKDNFLHKDNIYYENGKLKLSFSENENNSRYIIKIFYNTGELMYGYFRNNYDIFLNKYDLDENITDEIVFYYDLNDFMKKISQVDYNIPVDFIILHYLLETENLERFIEVNNELSVEKRKEIIPKDELSTTGIIFIIIILSLILWMFY